MQLFLIPAKLFFTSGDLVLPHLYLKFHTDLKDFVGLISFNFYMRFDADLAGSKQIHKFDRLSFVMMLHNKFRRRSMSRSVVDYCFDSMFSIPINLLTLIFY